VTQNGRRAIAERENPVAFCGVFRLKRRGLPAPRWRGAHSASQQKCAKARRHDL